MFFPLICNCWCNYLNNVKITQCLNYGKPLVLTFSLNHECCFKLYDSMLNQVRELSFHWAVERERFTECLITIEWNRKEIPFYALRSKLKLPNSSNPVKRSNNMVTSEQQKHNGMIWIPNGSYALTALSAVVLNGRIQ